MNGHSVSSLRSGPCGIATDGDDVVGAGGADGRFGGKFRRAGDRGVDLGECKVAGCSSKNGLEGNVKCVGTGVSLCQAGGRKVAGCSSGVTLKKTAELVGKNDLGRRRVARAARDSRALAGKGAFDSSLRVECGDVIRKRSSMNSSTGLADDTCARADVDRSCPALSVRGFSSAFSPGVSPSTRVALVSSVLTGGYLADEQLNSCVEPGGEPEQRTKTRSMSTLSGIERPTRRWTVLRCTVLLRGWRQ